MLSTALVALLSLPPQPVVRVQVDLRERVQTVTALQVWAEQLRCAGGELRDGRRLPEGAEKTQRMGMTPPAGPRLPEALAAFNASLLLCPDDWYTLLGRARTFTAQGRHDEAATDYTRMLALRPDWWDNWVWLGEAWISRGDLDQARRCFDHAADLRPPGKWRCDARLAEASCWLGVEVTYSRNSMCALAGLTPEGVAAVPLERQSRAESAIAHAMLMEPDDSRERRAKLHAFRGIVRHGMGRHAEAAAEYDQALTDLTTDYHLHYWRAEVAAKRGDRETAFRHLDLAEGYGLGRPFALWLRGHLHRDAGEWERVEACIAECLAILPDDVNTLRAHGSLLRHLGKDEAADRAARRVAELAGTNWAIEVLLQAWSLGAEFGQWKAADRLHTRTLDAGGLSSLDQGLLYFNRGKWRCDAGPTEEGYEDMTRAVRLAPHFTDFRTERARQALFLMRYADAIEDADAVCRQRPHDPAGWKLLREARGPEEMAATLAGRKPDFRPAGPVVKLPIEVSPGAKLVAARPEIRRAVAMGPPGR